MLWDTTAERGNHVKDKTMEGKELKDVLQPGLSIELFVKQGDYRGRYRSKIEDKEKEMLTVAVPFSGKGFLPLHEGEEIELFFLVKNESYAFETEILCRQTDTVLPTFLISEPSKAYRKQRRNFVRTDCLKNIHYQLVDSNKKKGAKQEAQMLDISGGGFLLVTNQVLNENDKVLIHLPLNSEVMKILCRVRRVEEVDSGNKKSRKKYKLSMEFQEISERDRDKIVRHVFDIERDLRRRGLK